MPWYIFNIPWQHAGHTRVAMVYLTIIDPERGVFGEIFPSGTSSLKEIFRRIPRAEGL